MDIVGCIITFNNVNGLRKTLYSIEDLVDRVIVVDGGIEGITTEQSSSDGTFNMVNSYHRTYIWNGNSTGKPYKNEVYKRNKYLKPWALNEGDWIFIIDDDEYVDSGARETRELLERTNEKCLGVTIWKKSIDGEYRSRQGQVYVRLIRYVKGMQYQGNHYTIVYPDGTSVPRAARVLSPLHIGHDQTSHGEKYRKIKDEYNKGLVDVEGKPVKRKRGRPRKYPKKET